MGKSSGGGSPQAPNIPAPPANLISSQGSTAPFAPNYSSFLPGDPAAMATGLTPGMMASIDRPPPPPPAQASATSGQMNPDAMRNMIAQMMGPRQMTGEERFMGALTGRPPEWMTPEMQNQRRNDALAGIFAGNMGPGAARGGR